MSLQRRGIVWGGKHFKCEGDESHCHGQEYLMWSTAVCTFGPPYVWPLSCHHSVVSTPSCTLLHVHTGIRAWGHGHYLSPRQHCLSSHSITYCMTHRIFMLYRHLPSQDLWIFMVGTCHYGDNSSWFIHGTYLEHLAQFMPTLPCSDGRTVKAALKIPTQIQDGAVTWNNPLAHMRSYTTATVLQYD